MDQITLTIPTTQAQQLCQGLTSLAKTSAGSGNREGISAAEQLSGMLFKALSAKPAPAPVRAPANPSHLGGSPQLTRENIVDLSKLKGVLSEGRIRQQGYSQKLITEAKNVGLLVNVAGGLAVVDAQYRERKLAKLLETVAHVVLEGLEAKIQQILSQNSRFRFGHDYWFENGLKTVDENVGSGIAEVLNQSGQVGQASYDPNTQTVVFGAQTPTAPQAPTPDEAQSHSELPSKDSSSAQPAHAITGQESIADLLLKNPHVAIVEAKYPVGASVVKTIDNVAVPCTVVEVNGTTYKLVTADGKNVPVVASEAELAIAPVDPEEAKKKAALAQQAPVQKSQGTVDHPLG